MLHNFVNADLAEPWCMQDVGKGRIEVVVDESAVSDDEGEWVYMMSVDVQQAWPYFWYVIRRWRKDAEGRGDSVLVAQGHADTWDELDHIRQKHNVPNAGVIVDAGFGPLEHAEVYRECVARATKWGWQNPVTKKILTTPIAGAKAVPLDGWLPAKGFPSRKKWRDKNGVMQPWRMQVNDPYRGTEKSGQVVDRLFEFAADHFLDILQQLRAGRLAERWIVPKQLLTEEYKKHLDARIPGDRGWVKRSKNWPDHLLDCEVMQVAYAYMLGLLRSSRGSQRSTHREEKGLDGSGESV
jgi:hypothetical protein